MTGLLEGYQNIHLNPLFRHRIAYGTSGFPWTGLRSGDSQIRYGQGLCPVAERLHQNSFIGLNLCAHEFTDCEVDVLISAFEKVWAELPKSASR